MELWFQAKNGFVAIDNIEFNVVPEPSSLVTLALLGGMILRPRRRARV